ncbi:MAG: acyl-CoA dehydrogenase family protein, partial [Acidimicrobiia bacterium]
MTSAGVIDHEDFRAQALRFLHAHAEPRPEVSRRFGEGSDRIAVFPERSPQGDAAEVAAARDWRSRVYDAGFGWISGPAAYGGRGLSRDYERLYQRLEAGFEVPPGRCFGIGLGMIAPTILAHAADEVKRTHLRAMYRGDLIACQLFSEPAAGSDLAGIQTRATRDGDEWILDGQKVWTSGAHYADFGEIITRSSTEVESPHRGLTMFLVDMRAPG